MKKAKKKKQKLTPEERRRRLRQHRHEREIRTIFTAAGATRVPQMSKKQITFRGTSSDVDDLFLYENIFFFLEFSTGSDISGHLKKKYVLYQKINAAPDEF